VGLIYRIRAAVPSDESRIRRCLRRAFPGASSVPEIAAERGFLAVADDEVIGVLAFRAATSGFQVDVVAVDPARQGHGVGSALIKFAEHEALLAGYSAVAANVPESSSDGLAVWERRGYRPVERLARIDGTLISLRKLLT
jgi:GNAT superfamily N-acetyltransferase